MKNNLQAYLITSLLLLSVTAVVFLAGMPNTNLAKYASLVDCEPDSENETENETVDADDAKAELTKWQLRTGVAQLVWQTKIPPKGHCARQVHLEIFTPPPEC